MKIKKFLLSSVVPLSIAPSALIMLSAEPGENPNSQPAPKPEKNDPDFASFKSKQEELIKESTKEYVEKAIEELFAKAQELIQDKDAENVKENYAKALYYQQVAWYLKDNQDKIVENPYQYGFEIVFPKILGTQKSYKFGDITVGDRTFSGVSVGTTKPYDYTNLLKKENIKLEKDNKVNSIDYKGLEKTTKDYFNGLSSSIDDIFVNKEDLPEFTDESVELDKERPSFKLKLPEGYTDWKTYIKDKISNRFLIYDLEQNETFNEPEEEPTPPVVEPIIPNEEPIQIELNPQNVARLEPYVNYNFYNQNFSNGASEPDVQFWFKNPIYTRINYRILSAEGETAKVNISDRSNDKQSSNYDAKIQKHKDLNYAIATQLATKIIEKTYFEFYQSMGLDQLIKLESIGSQDVGTTVFTLIDEAIKVVNEEDDIFNKLLNDLIESNKNQFEGKGSIPIEQLYNSYQNSSFTRKVQVLFLSTLNYSKINGSPYWTYLGTGWEKFYNRYVTYVKSQKETITKNFESANANLGALESGIDTLHQDIITLKGLGIFSGINVIDHYKKIVEINKKIYDQFKSLGDLTTNQEIDFKLESQAKDRFYDSLGKLNNKAYQATRWHKTLLLVLGIIITLISVFFMILALALLVFKRKGLLKSSLKLILATFVGSSTFVAGIIMTLLGIFGG